MALSKFFRRKPVGSISTDTTNTAGLKQSFTLSQLVLLGVAAIIGAGIYGTTADAAQLAGPAVTISFLLAGLLTTLVALCFAELASKVPSAGGAFQYAYATLGEIPAFFIGWMLLLGYIVGVAGISIIMGDYVAAVLPAIPRLNKIVGIVSIALVSLHLSRGVEESAKWARYMAIFEAGTLLIFVIILLVNFDSKYWTDFMPNGWTGVAAGAASIFLAFVGFEAIANAAEECKDPRRVIPQAILLSVGICTVLYVFVGFGATGVAPISVLAEKAPMKALLAYLGLSVIVPFFIVGIVVSIKSTIVVLLYALSRIVMSMARDGLLPSPLARLHPDRQTPDAAMSGVAACAIALALFIPVTDLFQLVDLGVLLAFLVACIGVFFLRLRMPDQVTYFKHPVTMIVPVISVCLCVYLAMHLKPFTWLVGGVWALLGTLVYFAYSARNSKLN